MIPMPGAIEGERFAGRKFRGWIQATDRVLRLGGSQCFIFQTY